MTRDDAIRILITAWCKIPPELKPPNAHLEILCDLTGMDPGAIDLIIYSEGSSTGRSIRRHEFADFLFPTVHLVALLIKDLTLWKFQRPTAVLQIMDDSQAATDRI